MTQKQVNVWYRYQSITAKPLYISNDDVRRVAAPIAIRAWSLIAHAFFATALLRV
jgi:hypothetical protein